MRSYTVEELVGLVRVKMDEASENASDMMGDYDDSHLTALIRSCIADGYRFVNLGADVSLLEGVPYLPAPDAFRIDDELVGVLDLPDDFLRGVSVRLSSWHSSPAEFIGDSSAEYRMQRDPYACGTYQLPVAAVVGTADGRKMELYKAREPSDTLANFTYIPSVSLCDGCGEVFVSDQLAESFIYGIAAFALASLREPVADSFFQMSKQLIGITNRS